MSDFVTKDSGVRAEYASGMVRDTQEGKPRFDLLIPEGVPFEAQFLTRVADLMTRGIAKYGLRNWEKANSPEELDRFKASALRHHAQYQAGETDEDHAAAVVFNLLAAETVKHKIAQAQEPPEERREATAEDVERWGATDGASSLVDGEGDRWTLRPDGLYRLHWLDSDLRPGRTVAYIEENYGLSEVA